MDVKWEMRGGKRLAAFTNKMLSESNYEIAFGFLRPDPYPDKWAATVSEVAKAQEFGTEHIPARPFMRPASNSLKQLFPKQVALLMKKNKNILDKNVAAALGEFAKRRIQSEIRLKRIPANAASTIAKKGFDNPLIHTRHMLQHVRYTTKKRAGK